MSTTEKLYQLSDFHLRWHAVSQYLLRHPELRQLQFLFFSKQFLFLPQSALFLLFNLFLSFLNFLTQFFLLPLKNREKNGEFHFSNKWSLNKEEITWQYQSGRIKTGFKTLNYLYFLSGWPGVLMFNIARRRSQKVDLFIWGLTSLSTLYRSYHDG